MMSSIPTVSTPSTAASPRLARSIAGSVAFDWAMAGLGGLLVCGLYLDIWAHKHGKVDQSFFTPWHAVLYSAFAVGGGFLALVLLRNVGRGYHWKRALPPGYMLSLLGVMIFSVGGLLDLLWHSVFGIEANIEALLSPTHLLLALGAILIVAGPLRSAWQRYEPATVHGWAALGPLVVAAALVVALLAAMTSFAHPFIDTFAGKTPDAANLSDELYVMNVDGSAQTRLTPNARAWHGTPAWSPDGTQLAYAVNPSASDASTADLIISNADGAGLRQLTRDGRDNFLPAWSPDGTAIAYTSYPHNKFEQTALYRIGVDGSHLRRLTPEGLQATDAVWSPDGARIIFSGARDGHWQIYSVAATGGPVTALTNAEGNNVSPTLSPDGKAIAYTSYPQNKWEQAALYRIGVDGSHLRRLTPEGLQATDAVWSRDGVQIVFSGARDGHWQIYRVAAAGGPLTALTSAAGNNFHPRWSPDGKQVAYVSSRADHGSIYVANADGTGERDLVNNPGVEADGAHWSPDGRRIVYLASGHPRHDAELGRALGVASIVLQSALLMGLLVLLAARWALPFGALTAVLLITTTLASVLQDQYQFIAAAAVAGVLGDLLLQYLRPATALARLRLFAFAVPALLYAGYFATLAVVQGIGWSVPMWSGAIVLAGIAGVLISLLVMPFRSVRQGERQGRAG
jgi:Tol biopolymer transport system component